LGGAVAAGEISGTGNVTIELWGTKDPWPRWSGSGSHDVYVADDPNNPSNFKVKKGVNFSEEITTVAWGDFTVYTP
jgi:hypothetical protein